MRRSDLENLEARRPGVAHQQTYEQFLESRNITSLVQYVTNLCRAAEILGRQISPALLPSVSDVKAVVAELRQGQYQNEKFSTTQTALQRYAEMVAENFKGHFSVTPLSSKGRHLLEAIVNYINTHNVDSQQSATYPTYDQLYHAVAPSGPKVVRFVGRNLRFKGLDELNDWTTANTILPKVTGLIVSRSTERPNDSFFTWYNKQPVTDDAWWREEVSKSMVFDWSPYIGTQLATSPIIVADDLDDDELAPRVKGEVSRIVRDTKITREIKALHNHTCQLCGLRLELSPGTFYSEAHHLKPLGKPHDGPDKKTNIVCVCPNCHAKLDYHAVRILPDKLRLKPGHVVSQRFIDHHNAYCP